RDRGVVPPDAHSLTHCPAHAQGGIQRRRRRPRGSPAAGGGRDDALLHVRGGPGGTQRLPRASPAGLLEVPQASMSLAPGPVRRWVDGARVRTLPASLVPVAVGAALVRPATLSWGATALCAIVALFLQVGTN